MNIALRHIAQQCLCVCMRVYFSVWLIPTTFHCDDTSKPEKLLKEHFITTENIHASACTENLLYLRALSNTVI